MPEAHPLVTIWCPSYNHEKYIAQAIEGFLAQKVNFAIKVIIHDDASTDGTTNIIRKYASAYPNIITPIYQTTNQFSKDGGFLARALVDIAKGAGKYIAICEGDDYWTDALKLQKQVDYLENNSGCSLCFHDFQVVGLNGEIIKQPVHDGFKRDRTSCELVRGCSIHINTVLFRNRVGEIPEQFYEVKNGDTFLLAFLAQYGNAGYLFDVLPSLYRQHAGGIWTSSNYIEKKRDTMNTFRMISQVVAQQYLPVIRYKILTIHFDLAKQYFMKQFYLNSIKSLWWACYTAVRYSVFRKPKDY